MLAPKTKRHAFIDVQNTASTTQQLLGFIVDWYKLCDYLVSQWKCSKVFFYSGINEGDIETAKEFELLAKNGCITRTKTVFAYKKPDKKRSAAKPAKLTEDGRGRKRHADRPPIKPKGYLPYHKFDSNPKNRKENDKNDGRRITLPEQPKRRKKTAENYSIGNANHEKEREPSPYRKNWSA